MAGGGDRKAISFRDVTVGRLLSQLAEALPANEALVYADRGLRWTFRELEHEARVIARGLIAAGVQRGDRIAVWATNVPEWIVLQFALAKVGAILVTVNTSLRAREIEYLLRRYDGAYRWHLGRALPIRDAQGNVVRWFGTNTDIHALKSFEGSLQRSESRFRALSDALAAEKKVLERIAIGAPLPASCSSR